MTRVLTRLASVFLSLGLAACVEPPSGFSHDLTVISIHPADGSAAVPVEVDPKIVFSQDVPRRADLEVTLHRGALSTPLNCRVGADPSVMECPLSEELLPDAWYRIEVDIAADGEVDAESSWTTSAPDGLAYDVGPGMTVDQIGGNSSAVSVLEDLLLSSEDHLVLVLDRFVPGKEPLPWEGNWLLGHARLRENLHTGLMEALIDEDDGLTISTRGSLQPDGQFHATSDYASLPVEVDGESLQLLLEEVTLSGNIPLGEHDYERVQNLELNAAVSEHSLDSLAEAVPEWARVIADLAGVIELDVDLDGDGTDDAATFQLSSFGERVQLAE